MLLSELFSQYLAWLQSARQLSPATTKNYRCRIRRFLHSLPPAATVADLTRPGLARYLRSIDSPRAVRMHVAAIGHFCRWLVSEEWLRVSPAAGMPLPRVARNRREPVPDDAIDRLLAACERLPGTEYRRALARATLAILVYGGLRRSEALRLQIEDVRLDTGEIFVRHGKGERSRSVWVCRECIEALRTLIRLRPACDHATLLAQNRRYGLQYHGLRTIFLRVHRVAGLETVFTPHQLRHACASRLAKNGASLPTIQAFLGHSRLETTAIYLHTNEEQLKAIAHLTALRPALPVETTAPTAPAQTKTAPVPRPASTEKRERFHIERRKRLR